MMTKFWPKATPTAYAQAILNAIAKRLTLLCVLAILAKVCWAFRDALTPEGSLLPLLISVLKFEIYLSSSYFFLYFVFAVSFLAALAHLRNIALILGILKSEKYDGDLFEKAMSIAGASNRVSSGYSRLMCTFVGIEILILVAKIILDIPVSWPLFLGCVGLLSMASGVGISPLLVNAFIPFDENLSDAKKELGAYNRVLCKQHLPPQWSLEGQPGLTATAQSLVFLLATRMNKVSEYSNFFGTEETSQDMHRRAFAAN